MGDAARREGPRRAPSAGPPLAPPGCPAGPALGGAGEPPPRSLGSRCWRHLAGGLGEGGRSLLCHSPFRGPVAPGSVRAPRCLPCPALRVRPGRLLETRGVRDYSFYTAVCPVEAVAPFPACLQRCSCP